MVKGVQQAWSVTAADNGNSDDNITLVEGAGFRMPDINDAGRAQMAAIKAFANQICAGATYGGSGNAYTITSDSPGAITAYAAGMMFALRANHTNSGNVTVNIDGVGAKSVRDAAGAELAAGTIVSGGVYLLVRDQSNDRFLLVGGVNAGMYQPLDATLTAFGALSYVSGNQFPYLTASDTFALGSISANGLSLVAAADYAAMRTLLGLVIGTDVQAYDADTAKLDVAQTWGAARQTRELTTRGTYDLYTGANPGFHFFENDQATDEGWWTPFSVNNKTMVICATRTDSDGVGVNPIRILRGTGTAVNEIEFNAGFVDLNGDLDVSGRVYGGASQMPPVLNTGVSGTLTDTHMNATNVASGAITIPTGTAGHMFLISGGGTARTITRGSGLDMRVGGADVSSATLAAHGFLVGYRETSTKVILQGAVS